MIEVKTVTPERLADLERVFGTDTTTDRCWCMWFIISVRDYHAGGKAANQAQLCDLATSQDVPIGLVAYDSGEPVGWCAAGPRSRYARGIRTPSFAGRDPAEDDSVWLVPCFYIRRDARRQGVSQALLLAAVNLASDHGAHAVEGFPFAGSQRRYGKDLQVGVEPLFANCGFTVIRRPSGNRVVMRRELA